MESFRSTSKKAIFFYCFSFEGFKGFIIKDDKKIIN